MRRVFWLNTLGRGAQEAVDKTRNDSKVGANEQSLRGWPICTIGEVCSIRGACQRPLGHMVSEYSGAMMARLDPVIGWGGALPVRSGSLEAMEVLKT